MENLWLVEYSPKQGAFNVNPIKKCIEQNLEMLTRHQFENQMSGYIPIGVANSYEEARKIANEMKVQGAIDKWPGFEQRFAPLPTEADK